MAVAGALTQASADVGSLVKFCEAKGTAGRALGEEVKEARG